MRKYRIIYRVFTDKGWRKGVITIKHFNAVGAIKELEETLKSKINVLELIQIDHKYQFKTRKE